LQAEAGKRRRDGDSDAAIETAPAAAKPRRRRFDDAGAASSGGAVATGNVQSLQADIAKLQQQVASMHALAVPEEQKAVAVKALQDVISGKQAELAKAMAAGNVAAPAAAQNMSQSAAMAAAIGAGMLMGAGGSGGLASRIYVGSMPYEASEHDMRALFSQFGQIVKIDMSFEPLTGAEGEVPLDPAVLSELVSVNVVFREDEGLLLHQL
jgi:hypothetical protein